MTKLIDRFRAFRNPQPEGKSFSNAPWVEASVPTGDVLALGRRPSDVTHLVRMFTQWPYRCSTINAQGVASLPLRVYRERRNDEFRSKRIDKKTLDHVRAGCIGDTFKVLDSTDKMDEVTDRDHPLVAMLNRPNPWMSGFEFLEALSVSLQLAGTTFANTVQPETGPPTGCNFMPSPWVKIAADRENYVSHYMYGVDGSTERKFEANEVIRIKMPNPTGVDMLWGIGPLQAAYLWHEVSNNISVFQSQLFENGGFPSLVAVMKTATEDQLKRLKSKLDQLMRGARKAGTIATLSGDVTLTKWNLSQEELGFLQASKDKRDDIAAMFGVPTSLLTVENVNLANGKMAAPQWQLLTIRPLSQRIEDAFNTDLLPRFRAALNDHSLCVAFDNPVEEEQGVRGERASGLYQSGLITLNEAREEAGWDSVKDGDDFYSPAAGQPALGPNGFPLVAFNMDRQALPVATEKGYDVEPITVKRFDVDDEVAPHEPAADSEPSAEVGDSEVPRSDGGDTQSGPVSERLALWLGPDHDEGCCDGCEHGLTAKAVRAGEDIEVKDDDDDDLLRRLQRQLAGTERQLDAGMRAWFERMIPEIARSIGGDGGIRIDLSPEGDAGVILRDLLGDSVSEAFIRGVEVGLSEVEAADDIVVTATERARQFAQQNLVRLSESVLATTREGVELRIQEALATVSDPRELQMAVAEALGQDSTHVSRRIARTESNRMHQEGRLNGWRESGVVTAKRWIARNDSRVSQICREIVANYGTAALDEPFVPFGTIVAGVAMTYDPRGVMGPPAHPNCRSTMVAEI